MGRNYCNYIGNKLFKNFTKVKISRIIIYYIQNKIQTYLLYNPNIRIINTIQIQSSSGSKMKKQDANSYEQFIPAGAEILQKRLKSNLWNTRKQAYEQILYLLDQQQIASSMSTFQIGGKQYTVKKLIPLFEDIVDEQHPLVLITALSCVQTMIKKKLCSGRQFVKLTDQGFDKFPLKTNRGKQIMQKFADIIQRIDLDPQFLLNKLNSSAHQKCVIFALEVVSMLGMSSLIKKVKQMTVKHSKKAVRQVAAQIYEELLQLQNQEENALDSNIQSSPVSSHRYKNNLEENNSTQNLKIPAESKPRRKTPIKSAKAASSFQNKESNTTFNRSQLQILQKVSQFSQLTNKEQQKYCEDLTNFFQKYFSLVKNGKKVPLLPINQLGNLSYIIRVMIDSNNVIFSTSGLKILKTLTQSNCQLIPRSYPLLFIFEKFKLHATHQLNQLIYDVCDSLLLCNSLSTSRNIDLIQAVGEGANNKKANVKYGCFMVFIRSIAILYQNQQLFSQNYVNQGQQVADKMNQIYAKINEADVQKIKQKLYKYLVKALQSFSSKLGDDKKYDQKIQDVKIIMSLAYGSTGGTATTQSAVSSIDNLKNKTLKKTLSQVGPKVETYNSRPRGENKSPKSINLPPQNQQILQKQKNLNSRNLNDKNYKIINPQQKTNKILTLTCNPTPGSINSIKKLILESLLQFEQCIQQQRFQLFYYSQVIQNFINLYEPNQKTTDLISQFLLQLLLKISKIKINSKNYKVNSEATLIREGLRNIMKICLCSLVLGNQNLSQILMNISSNIGVNNLVQSILMLDDSKRQLKIKKKNRKVLLEWLDANVPSDCLSDRLFVIMQKIQKGQGLGKTTFSQSQVSNSKQFRSTFGRQNKDQTQQYKQLEMGRKITFNAQDNNKSSQKNKTKKQYNLQQTNRNKKEIINSFDNIENNHLYNQQDNCIYNDDQLHNRNLNAQSRMLYKQKERQNKNNFSERLKQKQIQLKSQQMKFIQHLNRNNKNINDNIIEKKPKQQIVTFKSILPSQISLLPQNSPKLVFNKNSLMPNQIDPLDRSQISRIQHIQDPSISMLTSAYGSSTDRQILNQYNTHKDGTPNKNLFNKYQQNNYVNQQENQIKYNDQQENSKYEQYYNQLKKQKQRMYEEQNRTKTNQLMTNTKNEKSLYQISQSIQNSNADKSQQQQDDEQNKLQEYKQYIKKIRETYLPKQYIEKKQNMIIKQQNEIVTIKKPQQQIAIKPSSVTVKVPDKQKLIEKQEQVQSEQQQSQEQQFTYKMINANKLTYMIQNASNPYSHLRNQILLPFKKSQDKQYFLKQLNLFITSMACIKQPQPYNSLLLTVILLFSEIHSNRALITPLQQLYEHMATLVSTNQFLRTIISLFHSVIQQTSAQLRAFLITILTKSVARMMPFCQDPIQLLADLSQFYNVGQNVYFQMYEPQYKQICDVIQGQALYDVIEKALIKEGPHLKVIVDSWFDTKLKNKVKQYIEEIINENEEQEITNENKFERKQY